MSADSASIRRFAGWALVGGLSVAAAAAVLALLTGSFSDTDALRKMQPAGPPWSVSGNVDCGTAFLATAVIEIADRIELLNSDPGNREPQIRAQVNRLRDLAQGYES